MLIKVTKDTVKIVDENYVLNKGEYHVNTCYFEFSEEYTDDLVKKAIFVNDSIKKEMLIANNQCNIPYEVLVNDSFELRVYAYEIDENEELILRYSPTHTVAYLREGSYVSGATAGEEITPTQFEQYQQALQEGLAEVNEKLDDVDTAITEANNLDAEVTKVAMRSTLSITKKDGTIQSVDILDGENGNTGPAGRDGVDGITPTIGDNGNWYLGNTDTGKPSRGIQGETGPAGADGRDGQDGSNGQDGYSPSASVSKSGDTATITITDKNGTTTTTISDGTNGTNGTNGTDGYSPTATVTKSGTTATISITDKNGTTTATVSDGTNGTNGQDGQNGVGVPTGGTQGQILAKATGTDYDTEWINVSSGEKVIYDFLMPSDFSFTTTSTKTYTPSNLDTDRLAQLNAIITKGYNNVVVRLIFNSGNFNCLANFRKNETGSTDNVPFTKYTYSANFLASNDKNYQINFAILIMNNAISSIQLSSNNNLGYVYNSTMSSYVATSKVKTSQNTTSGNVYDVTYINSVVGNIESLLGGI